MLETGGRKVDAVKIVDEASIGKLVITLVILCAGVSFLDGFDILAISYVAPVIGQEWKLPREAFGPVFAAHYIGAAIGSVFFGWYADRYGRRMGVIIPTVIFGLAALLTVYAYDFRSLFGFRLLIGVGLGGALSNAIALVSEYAPRRARATLVSLMYAAFPLGGVIGGPLSALVIAHYGWRAVFVLGGLLPLLLAIALLFWLREFDPVPRPQRGAGREGRRNSAPDFTVTRATAVRHIHSARKQRHIEEAGPRPVCTGVHPADHPAIACRIRRAAGDCLRGHLDAAGPRIHRLTGHQRYLGIGSIFHRRCVRRYRSGQDHR